MVTTRELRGSKQDIARQIERESQRIISVLMFVEEQEPAVTLFRPNEEEAAKMMAELDALAVSAPHADDSREAMYTRMPGE